MEKKKILNIIDFLLLLTLLAAAAYLYSGDYHRSFSALAGTAAAFMTGYFIWQKNKGKVRSPIKIIALINEEEDMIEKEWHIVGKQGLLIGKNARNNLVDIDLAEIPYAAMVAEEHAVMNLVGKKWYIEDLGSRNGIGLRKKDKTGIRKLPLEEQVEINVGDRIYVGKAVLTFYK